MDRLDCPRCADRGEVVLVDDAGVQRCVLGVEGPVIVAVADPPVAAGVQRGVFRCLECGLLSPVDGAIVR